MAAAKKGFDPVPSTLVIGEEVDRGSFGVVYLATLDKKSVAVKRFHKVLMTNVGPGENVPLKNFKTECERLKDLNHPNVVRYIGAYEDKKGPLLVMELMYESLEVYLKYNKGRLSPERVLEICSSVCEGMAYLHGRDKPLIHRDLGSKNVLLTEEGVVRIADFGQSKLLQNRTDSLMTTQPGTIAYMPPEALTKGGEYTDKVDSFSLGVLILEVCTQSLPSSGWEGINYVIEVIRREKDLSLLDDAHPLKPLIVWCLQHEKLRPAVAVIHHHVKNMWETSKIEMQKLQREKDQSKKDFKELQKAMERNEVERGELNAKKEKAEKATREAVDEVNKLKEEVKCLQESLDKEPAEKIQQCQADFNAEPRVCWRLLWGVFVCFGIVFIFIILFHNEQLQSELKRKVGSCQQLQDQCHTLQDEVDLYSDKVALVKAQTALEETKSALEGAEMKSKQLQRQLIASEKKLKLKEEELQEAKKEIDRSRASSVELAEQKDKIEIQQCQADFSAEPRVCWRLLCGVFVCFGIVFIFIILFHNKQLSELKRKVGSCQQLQDQCRTLQDRNKELQLKLDDKNKQLQSKLDHKDQCRTLQDRNKQLQSELDQKNKQLQSKVDHKNTSPGWFRSMFGSSNK